jgi:pilus assembly protein FimV
MKKAHRSAIHLFQQTALCAALSLSVFGNAQALTLSRPVVQSKQGEALRAEIDVSEITIAEQIELEAKIASPEVYQAAKVELPTANGQPIEIQVQLLRRDHGWPYLKITSKQPITANFLDVLIDLRWATGRLLRDVSLSIDDSNSKKPTAPLMPGFGERNVKATEMPSIYTKNAQGQFQVTVKRGDTASDLASKKSPEGVSLDQMLVALLRNNPDAFVDNNVNRMKEGALLTLPTEQEAKAVSREEARREISVQAKDFEAYRAELAARAPGGVVPKVAKDASGKLEAKVQNKNSKANQDKLTLAKPGSKESAAEDKIAQQREAQDVASRAAELSRNIAELGKIAAATVAGATGAADAASAAASEPVAAVIDVNVPASAAEANSEWLNDLRENSLTPIGAASLIALLVLVGLWRRRALNKADDNIEGLPPLNVKFNLDLPENDRHEPVERAYIHDVATHAHDTHEHPHDHAHRAHDEDALQEEDHAAHHENATRPTMEMPNISLDLDEPDTNAGPYQVRIDLADELWNLGQLHTSKALMEEVANEASGADKEKALKWLAERG